MWAKYILKKYLCKGKSYEKKFAHQVALKNIPKIQWKGNNNEKNSCGSKKVPPHKERSIPYLLLRPEMSRKYIFSFPDLLPGPV